MRKQYQWVALLLITGLFFCSSQDNNLKACDNNVTACTAIKEKVVNAVRQVKKIEVEYGAEEDGSMFMLADRLIYSN